MKPKLGLVLAMAAINLFPAVGEAASTSLTQNVAAGTLTISSTASSVLSGATLNAAAPTTSIGTLGAVTVTDSRGSGAGWSATATSTNFFKLGTPVRTSGSSSATLTPVGTYSGSSSGTYTVTITAGGTIGTAMYSISGLETQGSTVLNASSPIGTKGVSLNVSGGPFAVGDQWTISVDILPISGLTLTPTAITGATGSLTGVSPGSIHTFTDGNDPATLVTASSGNGMGQYVESPNLAMVIPTSAKIGSYTAVVTETVN